MSSPGSKSPLVLGRYALLRLLGRGGMGSVYLARVEGAAGFRKPVAIKLIHQHLMDDPSAVKAFVREAKLVVRLSHPNIVQVLDFGEHGGQYLTILEYVQGYDLGVISKFLRQTGRALSVDHAGLVLYKVLRGLEFAHDLRDDHGAPLGLVHRDISPQNILISTDGQVLLTDFGIARVRTEATRSGQGELKGKLAYLSPEQVSNRPVDRRSDLFAVGIVMFEVLSGVRLFHCESEAQTIMKVARAEVPDITKLRPDIPPEVGAVLAKALAVDPGARYQDAAEFARDVRRHLLSSAPDEVEPSFREMVRQTVSEPEFVEHAGHPPDLSKELDGEPLELPLLAATKRPGRGETTATRTKTLRSTRRQRQMRLFLSLAVSVTALAALVSGAVLFGLGARRDGAASGATPVKVIVEDRAHDAEPAATDAAPATTDAAPATTDAAPATTDAVSPSTATTKTPRPLQPLDGRRVTRTLMRRRAALLGCFQRGGAAATKVKSVVIRLEVGGDGRVRWAKVEPTSVQSSPMGKCLAAVAAKTRFPRHPSEALVFRVPIAVSQQ